MGVYDTYGTVQIKIGPKRLKTYEIGAFVPLKDGIYLGIEGAIVVLGGVFVAEFSSLFTKWGGRIRPFDLICSMSPIMSPMTDLVVLIKQANELMMKTKEPKKPKKRKVTRRK